MDVERLIETALSGYAVATPLAGLEQRVSHRIRIARARRRHSRYLAASAVGLAAGLVLIFAPRRTQPITTTEVPAQIVSLRSAPIQPRVPVRKRVPKRRRHPTGEELALASLVERYPAEAQLAFAGIQPAAIEPIEITPIDIRPLPGYEPQ
ncbi:MAG: hypothetical protein ACR2NN_25690 [Bryobacteraceae bacterium]